MGNGNFWCGSCTDGSDPQPGPLPNATGYDCDGNEVGLGQPVVHQGVVDVRICPGGSAVGIEASLAPVGCAYNEFCQNIGQVYVCKKVDEESGQATYGLILVRQDGTIQDPYTGSWDDCESPSCFSPAPIPCNGWMGSFVGSDDFSFVEPFDSIAITKPECCEVTITTNVGTVTLPPKIKEWCPDRFACDLTQLEITGECLDEVCVFLQRTGHNP